MAKLNPVLLIGALLPIAFIIILAAILMLPASQIKPAYDFIYIDERSYSLMHYETEYDVVDGRIVSIRNEASESQTLRTGAPTLYRYNVGTDTVDELTLEEAQAFTVDPGPSSPDGYTISYDYGNSGVFELFGSGGPRSSHVIQKDGAGKRLPGLARENYYSGQFTLIGWITN